jgi:hypothetical protein
MQQKLYFPVSVDEAMAILRRQLRLDQVCSNRNAPFLAYTDRALAVLEGNRVDGEKPREVSLLVVEFDEHGFGQLFTGDYAHYGPCGIWRAANVLELEHWAEAHISHHGRYSLEIVLAHLLR